MSGPRPRRLLRALRHRAATGRPLSLTTRLVLTTVAIVLVVVALVGTVTTVAVRDYLQDRLDDEVRASVRPLTDPDLGEPSSRFSRANQRPGTLNAHFVDGRASGHVLGDRRTAEDLLGPEALGVLAGLPRDGRLRTVDVPGAGEYRLVALDVAFQAPGRTPAAGVLVTGLPVAEVDDAVAQVVRVEVLVGLLALLAAAGLATLVVRRQLGPLRQVAGTAAAVATLPLAEGEIALGERVPEELTDERTEVGRVGASLNALLAHVETSLAARHRSEQQVRQFLADASHELRTPLATIKGYAELARRRPDETDAVLTALAKVEAESARMTGLVEDLLLLARLDAGRPLERRPVDLTRLLLEAVADARVLAPDHRWRLDLPDDALGVLGDEQRLHQAVTNLLANARRHTPPGTTVTVRARPGTVEVHDDGPGFADDLLPHAFERFARGDGARTRESPGGSGLGLALVQAIAAAHGGAVTLESRPGDTRVVLRLPSAGPGR